VHNTIAWRAPPGYQRIPYLLLQLANDPKEEGVDVHKNIDKDNDEYDEPAYPGILQL